ncbi:hypothetical protein [Prosthecobacter sp.]|uniref:hypothetical protein n=1 Tax=Prosthecobacter sp. TaxID=1965333 RepID=UPI00378424E9
MRHKNHFPRWVQVVAVAGFCVVAAGCKDRPDAPPGKMNLRLEPINPLSKLEVEREKAGLRPVEKEWRNDRYDASSVGWAYVGGRFAKSIERGPQGPLVESDNFPTGRPFPSPDGEGTSFETCVARYSYETRLCQVYVMTDDATVEEWVRGEPTSPGIDVASAHALVEKILRRWKVEALLGKWGEVPPKK